MWNPFNKQKKQVEEEQKESADYQLSAQLASPQYAPPEEIAMQERKEALVQLSQWQQDRKPAMQQLFCKLSAYQFNPKRNMLEKIKWDSPYCELNGATKLIGFIETLDHNVMLANWSDKTILITMRDAIAHPLRRFIFENHQELGISINHAEYVFWSIVNTIEPNYWRGWNDGERRKDKEIIKVNELRNPYYGQKKKNLLGMEA